MSAEITGALARIERALNIAYNQLDPAQLTLKDEKAIQQASDGLRAIRKEAQPGYHLDDYEMRVIFDEILEVKK